MKTILLIFIFFSIHSFGQIEVEYFSEAKNMPTWMKNFDTSEYNLYSINGELQISHNGPFASAFHSNVSLVNDSLTIYDGRILGVWTTKDESFIYAFVKINDGKPFNILRFAFDKAKKKYIMDTQMFCNVASVDSTQFVEITYPKNSCSPFNYKLLDNDHLILTGVSIKYSVKNPGEPVTSDASAQTKFSDVNEVRRFMRSNMANADFYRKPLYLYRYKRKIIADPYVIVNLYDEERKWNQVKKSNDLGAAILLLIGASIILSDHSGANPPNTNENYQMITPLKGYDAYRNPVFDDMRITYDVNGKYVGD